ncbi:hypothetical protein CPC08DRAFT_382143 [Agrocybe pediades]|nr:hypothetical protein CPC08DRAFT_382143 [Agrocybe pediades]
MSSAFTYYFFPIYTSFRTFLLPLSLSSTSSAFLKTAFLLFSSLFWFCSTVSLLYLVNFIAQSTGRTYAYSLHFVDSKPHIPHVQPGSLSYPYEPTTSQKFPRTVVEHFAFRRTALTERFRLVRLRRDFWRTRHAGRRETYGRRPFGMSWTFCRISRSSQMKLGTQSHSLQKQKVPRFDFSLSSLSLAISSLFFIAFGCIFHFLSTNYFP